MDPATEVREGLEGAPEGEAQWLTDWVDRGPRCGRERLGMERMLGELVFAPIRDGHGTTQLVWRQGASPDDVRSLLETLTPETVVSAHGTVHERPADMQKVPGRASTFAAGSARTRSRDRILRTVCALRHCAGRGHGRHRGPAGQARSPQPGRQAAVPPGHQTRCTPAPRSRVVMAASPHGLTAGRAGPLATSFGACMVQVNEELRLTYRYLDLRRPELQGNLRTRSRVARTIREILYDQGARALPYLRPLARGTAQDTHPTLASACPRSPGRVPAVCAAVGFVEVETPVLFKTTPEGAREFLVPTRAPDRYYALSQSPQQVEPARSPSACSQQLRSPCAPFRCGSTGIPDCPVQASAHVGRD